MQLCLQYDVITRNNLYVTIVQFLLCFQYDFITKSNLYVTRAQFSHNCFCSMMSQETTCMFQEPNFYETFFSSMILSQEATCILQDPSLYETFLAGCYHMNQPVCDKNPVSTHLCLQYYVGTRTSLYVTRTQVIHNCVSSVLLSHEPICI